jgi:sterol desaturase/sphingolipid hydroxylase (fatty acid hydroxylase superfamily)
MEFFFDLPFMRQAFAKKMRGMKVSKVKKTVATILFFIGGSVCVMALLTIPFIFSPLMALVVVYLNVAMLITVIKRGKNFT